MSSRSPREVQAKAINLLTGMLPMLDAGNPNDRAFKLVSIVLCVCGLIVSYNKLIFDAWIPPPPPSLIIRSSASSITCLLVRQSSTRARTSRNRVSTRELPGGGKAWLLRIWHNCRQSRRNGIPPPPSPLLSLQLPSKNLLLL
jgi:hypothetical protein